MQQRLVQHSLNVLLMALFSLFYVHINEVKYKDSYCYTYLYCSYYLNSELRSSNTIVIDIVENYIENYNKVRIQQKLGYLSPIEYRKLAA